MKWIALALAGALACGSSQPTATTPPPAAPAPAPTLDDMVDAMCACKTPACADQVKAKVAGVDKPGDAAPHVVALRDALARCETTAREGDEVTEMGKMEDAMCACKDSRCVDQVQRDFKDFIAREGQRYGGDARPPKQILKMAEHMSECASRAYEGGKSAAGGTGLDHTAGEWHPAQDTGGAIDTGVPECDVYLKLFDRYMACDKIPQATKDASKEAIEAQKEGYASLKDAPADAKKAAADGCRQASDALKQAASALGCSL
jgi:hypothetical protein